MKQLTIQYEGKIILKAACSTQLQAVEQATTHAQNNAHEWIRYGFTPFPNRGNGGGIVAQTRAGYRYIIK